MKPEDIQGWMSTEELKWLKSTARRVPEGGLIVEIGAWKGKSSVSIYQGAENKTVVTIDTWKGTPSELYGPHAEAKDKDLLQIYLRNMREMGFDPRLLDEAVVSHTGILYIQGDSVESAKLFEDESIDFLFIDGDHTKCKDDIDTYMPKMKEGSLLTGHDYFCFKGHIQKEIHKRFLIDQIAGTIWIKFWKERPSWY